MRTIIYQTIICFMLFFFAGCSDKTTPEDELVNKDPNETEISDSVNYDSLMYNLYDLIEADFDSVATRFPFEVPDFYFDLQENDTGIQNTLEVFKQVNQLAINPENYLNDTLKSANGDSWELINKEVNDLYAEYTYLCVKKNYRYKCVYTNYFFNIITEEFSVSGTKDGIFYGDLEKDEYYLKSERSNQFGNLNYTEIIYFSPYSEEARGKEWLSRIYTQGETIFVESYWSGRRYITEHELVTIQYSMIGGHHPVYEFIDYWKGGLWELTTSWYCINYQMLRPISKLTYNFNEHEGSYCRWDCDGLPMGECKEL